MVATDKLKQDNDLKRIKAFLTNSTWGLNKLFEKYIKKSSHDRNTLIYIMGDPGIGKSSAFSSLIAGLNHGDSNVRGEFRKMFPALKDYEHFYYIDGSKLKKKELLNSLL